MFLIAGMLFISSCGEEKKQPELEKVESVDDLIVQEEIAPDTIKQLDTVVTTKTVVTTVTEKTETKEQNVPVQVTSSSDHSSKPLQGTVVSFNDMMIGGTGKVNKAQALDLVSKGNMIVLKGLDGKIYFVYNEDGSFAGKKLAGFANNASVGLLGKSKVVDGIHIFIMNLIEAM
jgi:hypothetical protein